MPSGIERINEGSHTHTHTHTAQYLLPIYTFIHHWIISYTCLRVFTSQPHSISALHFFIWNQPKRLLAEQCGFPNIVQARLSGFIFNSFLSLLYSKLTNSNLAENWLMAFQNICLFIYLTSNSLC